MNWQIRRIAQNPVNRCFFCKDELYRICRAEADKLGIATIVDGTNLDDLQDHRPGLKAANEWGVRHPLVEAEMTKDDIRRYSRELDLPTWDKPSSPCLSSRFPYGTAINLERLKQSRRLRSLHEVSFASASFACAITAISQESKFRSSEIDRLFDKATRDAIVKRFKEVGFNYVSVDLQGFRSGSLNEVVAKKSRLRHPAFADQGFRKPHIFRHSDFKIRPFTLNDENRLAESLHHHRIVGNFRAFLRRLFVRRDDQLALKDLRRLYFPERVSVRSTFNPMLP